MTTNLQREKKRTGSSTVESPPAVQTEAEVEGSTPSQPTNPPTETVSDRLIDILNTENSNFEKRNAILALFSPSNPPTETVCGGCHKNKAVTFDHLCLDCAELFVKPKSYFDKEPTVEKWRDEIYNAICLVNLTDRVGEGIKKVIEVFKKYQAQSVQEAKAEEATRIVVELGSIKTILLETIRRESSKSWHGNRVQADLKTALEILSTLTTKDDK